MRIILLGLLTISMASCLQARAQPKAQDDPNHGDVDTYLRSQMQKRRIPGLQIAVVRQGKIVKLSAYGLANIQDSIPTTNQTLFTINSITKAFTGVAIMQLVEAGKLDLAAPISRYLDNLPGAWQAVTIKQLLTNTSGLPNIYDDNDRIVSDGGESAVWAKLQTMPIEFAPGERFKYNATNYVLLGKVIDKLSGQPFIQFITERQLHIAGMPLTMFGDSHDVAPHSARGYTFFRNVDGERRRTDKLGNVFEEFSPFTRTASGMSSTAEEMARWIIALQQGKLLKAKTSLTTLWTPGALNNGSSVGFSNLLNGYALGWLTVTRPEHRAVAAVGGIRSALFIYPGDDLAVVILTNLQGAFPESFIDGVAGYYIPGIGLPPSIKALHIELMKRGFEHASEAVNAARQKDATFQLPEADVNAWGYRLLDQEQTKEAVEIFKLNVSLYPESANTYDSLADGYFAAGDQALAIKNYKRSLELNPKNTHAVERIKELERNGVKSGPN
jgi:CubicO group peptidase (beta-lactamase class C family)